MLSIRQPNTFLLNDRDAGPYGMVFLVRQGAGYKTKKERQENPAALFLSVFWLRDYYSTINSTWARRFNALPSLVSLSARGLDSP